MNESQRANNDAEREMQGSPQGGSNAPVSASPATRNAAWPEWCVRALVRLAQRILAERNATCGKNWPAGQGWHELGHTSQHAFMRAAREECGVPHEAYRDAVQAQADSAEYDLDVVWADMEERGKSLPSAVAATRPRPGQGTDCRKGEHQCSFPECSCPLSTVAATDNLPSRLRYVAEVMEDETGKMEFEGSIPALLREAATWREALEEVADALDKSLGDSDLTHIESDEELRQVAPVQWACAQINRLLQARPACSGRDDLAKALWAEVEGLRRNGGHEVSQITVDLMAQAAIALQSPSSSIAATVEGVSVSDILATADHIEKNGFSLKEYGGEMVDEGRCRELCAMYLREFVQTLRIEQRLSRIASATACGMCEQWKRWRDYANAEYRKATGRDIPQEQTA